MKYVNAVGSVIIMIILLAGCSSKESALTGKWKGQNGSRVVVVEFLADNTFVWEDSEKTINYSGKWNFTDDGRVKVEFATWGIVFLGKLEDGNLRFDDLWGKEKNGTLVKQ